MNSNDVMYFSFIRYTEHLARPGAVEQLGSVIQKYNKFLNKYAEGVSNNFNVLLDACSCSDTLLHNQIFTTSRFELLDNLFRFLYRMKRMHTSNQRK